MDISERDFQTRVLDRSHQLPVVVDFWAEWCGPCRQLGPALERAAAVRAGKLELAKVDVDANPRLSQTFRIQSIPAVKAFRDGRVVSEFLGNQPPAAIDRFLDALLPSEADALVAAGDEASLRRALELEPTRADALVPLARLLHRRGENDEALELAQRAPGNFAAEGLASRIALERAAQDGIAPLPDLRSALEALDEGDHERALELLIAAIPTADGSKDDLRRLVVGILDGLGAENPLAREARRRLAAALY